MSGIFPDPESEIRRQADIESLRQAQVFEESLSAQQYRRPQRPKLVVDAAPLKKELTRAAHDGRLRQEKTWVSLVILGIVAVVSVGLGLAASNPIFWAAAASVFFASSAAIIAYAAKSLGVFAQTIELINRDVPRLTSIKELHRE